MLDQIINNEAICDLIRCCFESPQISLRQLSVFLEMSQSDNATEHRLTFEDIESWNNEPKDDENNVVMVGSATFIDKWCLFGDAKEETKTLQKIQIQKGCQTKIIQTKEMCVNTEDSEAEKENFFNSSELMNISDCVSILPFNSDIALSPQKSNGKSESVSPSKQQNNLLILEFSNIRLFDLHNHDFSFQCQMDELHIASPIFNVDDDKADKVYIHIMVNPTECANILQKTLRIDLVANKEIMGEIDIDLRRQMEATHRILSTTNQNEKLGQVHVRVLPQFQFNILSTESSCNQSLMTMQSDDQSVASTEAWKLFNTFIVHKT